MISQLSIIKTSLESKRSEYLHRQTDDRVIKNILKPLIKRKELQFKHLFKSVNKKMARQTFVSNLQKAVNKRIVIKKEIGRSTYYSLTVTSPDEKMISDWLLFIKKRLAYIPDEFLLL